MPESNLLSLNLLHLDMIPSDYQNRIPVLPEAKRSLLMNKYQMSLETAMQIVVNFICLLLHFSTSFLPLYIIYFGDDNVLKRTVVTSITSRLSSRLDPIFRLRKYAVSFLRTCLVCYTRMGKLLKKGENSF